MSTEKKEKEIKILNKNDQNKFKALISILEIIVYLCDILILIAISFAAVVMIAIPVLVKNIQVEDNNITIFNQEYKYNINENHNLEIYNIETPSNKEVFKEKENHLYQYVIESLSQANIAKTFAFAEIQLIGVVAVLFIYYYALLCVKKLLSAIIKNRTPFTKDSGLQIRKVAYLMLTSYAVAFFVGLLSNIIFKYDSSFNLPIATLPGILGLFALSYVFAYGYGLQKQSKTTIFDEN